MNFDFLLMCRHWLRQSSHHGTLLPHFLWRLLDKFWNQRGWNRGDCAIPGRSVYPHGRLHEKIFVNLLLAYLIILESMDSMCWKYLVLYYVLLTKLILLIILQTLLAQWQFDLNSNQTIWLCLASSNSINTQLMSESVDNQKWPKCIADSAIMFCHGDGQKTYLVPE
jgi:hypothetical protein